MQQAITYMILAALLFTCLNFVIRAADHLPTIQLVFFRSLGSAICGFILLKRFKIPMKGNNPPMLILRGCVGLVAMFLFFKAMQMLPMASAVSLRYSAPIFATILSLIFLKEKVISWQWLLLATAFVGIIMLKGFDARISVNGFGIAMLSAFMTGLVYTIIRKIGSTEHPIVIVNYFMTISTVAGAIGILFYWTPIDSREWVMLLSMGLLGFGAQYYMTKAIQLAEANLITPFKYLEAVFTLIIGWAIFGEYQTMVTLLAMVIIVLSLVANVWVKARDKG